MNFFCKKVKEGMTLNSGLFPFCLDMNRTFPDNVKFRKNADPCLQHTLYNVLVAYGHHNTAVGYCQVCNHCVLNNAAFHQQ